MIFSAVGLQTSIWSNNLKSIFLLCCFPLLLLGMLWGGTFLYCCMEPSMEKYAFDYAERVVVEYWFYVFLAAGLWLVIAFFSHQTIINKASGAKFVERKDAEKIYNLLENLCISRGVTMPKIAIIETDALNAFASGITEKNYTITLTSGIIKALNDQELESVLGHELAHIINRDVRLLIDSVIFVGIFGFLAEMAFRSSIRGSRGKKNGHMIIVAVVVFTICYVISLLVRFSLSRRREYMADFCSVDMTKNYDAMISALQKISSNSQVDVPKDIAQMCIDNPKVGFFKIFATHPPIEDRIRVLKEFSASESVNN